MKKRIGRFKISHDLLQSDWKSVLPAFNGMLVVRAESRFDVDCIEYVGLSEDFEEVEEGVQAPEYEALLTKHENGEVTVKWQRSEQFRPAQRHFQRAA